jgi:hypothetical protein
MRARCLLAALALLLLPALPAQAATTSYVPGLVLDGTVPGYVSGTVAGAEVTLTVGDASATKVAAADSVVVQVAGLKAGLHEWSLAVLAHNVTTTTRGFVMVDTRLEDVYTALSLARADPRSAAALGNLTARLARLPGQAAENVTVFVEGNASAAGGRVALASNPSLRQDLQRVQAATSQTQEVARSARSFGLWATLAALGGAALMLPLNLLHMAQARRSRREALVFLLVLAARAGITPDSPEFQQAVAAFEGKAPKAKAAKKKAAPADGA